MFSPGRLIAELDSCTCFAGQHQEADPQCPIKLDSCLLIFVPFKYSDHSGSSCLFASIPGEGSPGAPAWGAPAAEGSSGPEGPGAASQESLQKQKRCHPSRLASQFTSSPPS